MNKIFIKTFIPFLIFILTSCTYKPIFSEKNYNFEIKEIVLIGEKDVGKIIDNKLGLIKSTGDPNKKKYILIIDSEKKRNIISKDSKGDPLKFEMLIKVEYKLMHENKLLILKEIEKNNIYNNDSDQFKLEQSEKIILQNISGNISDIIISSIINLNDN